MPEPVSPPAPSTSTLQLVQSSGFPHIPGYRFERPLGQGGMATVYLATQEWLDRPVAIKVMERDALLDETSKQRFENEARTIAKLTHPGIVHIYEVGRTGDGQLYYSMSYLANGDLSQRKLGDEAQIIEVLRALLAALDYAHARGIVHRDVKQENVLFDSDNRPLLTDFGIAVSQTDKVRVTTAGFAVGSSGYMAPEQARGAVVDRRADLYSLGVLTFELLTGNLPFHSADALAMALMHAHDPIPRLPAAKSHWQGFIDRAMAKSPDRRFENAQQMLEALERIARRNAQMPGPVRRTFNRAVARREAVRPRMLALVGALLLATGLYAARDRLPYIGNAATSIPAAAEAPNAMASARPPAIIPGKDPATPQQAPAPAPAPASVPPASQPDPAPSAAPSDAPSDAKPVQPKPAQRPAHQKRKHSTSARRQPSKTGVIRRWWQRIRRK